MNASRASRTSLTDGPITRTLVLFSLPILGDSVLQSLNISVNSIWIGNYLGEAALTASTNANLLLFLLVGSMFGLAMACTLLVAHAIGAGNVDQARRVFGTGITFFVGLSVPVTVAGFIFTPEILALMHTPADAIPDAIAYLRVIFVALPVMCFNMLVRMVLRGSGDSRTPFLFMIMAVAIDAVLNPLFIFGWGPVPAMGIGGSAGASLTSVMVALAALLVHMRRKRHALWLSREHWHYLKPEWRLLRAMVVKGLPMGMQMIVVSSSALVLIGLVNVYGSRVTAAYAAALQLWRYIQMPAIAIGSAVASMAAQNVAAGLWQRVNRITGTGMAYNLLVTGALVASVLVFEHAALGLFLPGDSAALAIAVHLDRIVVWSFLLLSVSFVLFGVIRSTGAVMPPLIILIITLWGVRIPFAAFMRDTMGADAVWWSFPLASALTLVLAAGYYRFGRWRQAQMLRPATANG